MRARVAPDASGANQPRARSCQCHKFQRAPDSTRENEACGAVLRLDEHPDDNPEDLEISGITCSVHGPYNGLAIFRAERGAALESSTRFTAAPSAGSIVVLCRFAAAAFSVLLQQF
jgi:hypothetical protein